MKLPEKVAAAVQPLFDALPMEKAMAQLVVDRPQSQALLNLVAEIVATPAIGAKSPLAAGLWLYVDDLTRSHDVSQQLKDATGSFWHGIMHRREGDFGNSHYWFRNTGYHPAMDTLKGYDPATFIDDVQNGYSRNAPELVTRQREEWQALFSWCAARK